MNFNANKLKPHIIELTKLLLNSLNHNNKKSLLSNFKISEDIYDEINENLQDYTNTSIGDGGIQLECEFSEKNVFINHDESIHGKERKIEVQFNGEADGFSCYRAWVPIFVNDVTDCLTLTYFIFIDASGEIQKCQYLNIEMM